MHHFLKFSCIIMDNLLQRQAWGCHTWGHPYAPYILMPPYVQTSHTLSYMSMKLLSCNTTYLAKNSCCRIPGVRWSYSHTLPAALNLSKHGLYYWPFIRKTYGDAHSKTGKVSNLVNGPILLNVLPCSCHLVEILENLLFHLLPNDACKFAINLFPITWGPFENVNFLLLWILLILFGIIWTLWFSLKQNKYLIARQAFARFKPGFFQSEEMLIFINIYQ